MDDQGEAGAPPGRDRNRYLVQSLLHATDVLRAFRHAGEALRLRDVMERTGFSKGLCFRLLHTLHHCGFLERVEGNRYQLTAEIGRRRRYLGRSVSSSAGAGPVIATGSEANPSQRAQRRRSGLSTDTRSENVPSEPTGDERRTTPLPSVTSTCTAARS